MKKTIIAIIAALAMLLPASGRAAAAGRPGPPIAHSILRVETHSDRDNPDNYLYKMFSVGKQLEGRVMGNVYYIYKQNLSRHHTGGYAVGVNISRSMSKQMLFTMGYAYLSNEPTTTRNLGYDTDRFNLGLYFTPLRKKDGSRLLFSSVFNTQTDLSDNKTIDFGAAYKAALSDDFSADMGYKYTWLIDPNSHLFNQWNIDLSYAASKRTSIDAGYMLLDKTYNASGAATVPDNDNVFRLGVKYSYY
jgi:hypothetical protein